MNANIAAGLLACVAAGCAHGQACLQPAIRTQSGGVVYYLERDGSTSLDIINDHKDHASTIAAFLVGEVIVGESSGAAVRGTSSCRLLISPSPSRPSIDYWKPRLGIPNAAPNQYRITFVDGASTHIGSLLGITQTNGNANLGDYVSLLRAGDGQPTDDLTFSSTVSSGNQSPAAELLASYQGKESPNAVYSASLRCLPQNCPPVNGGQYPASPGGTATLLLGAAQSALFKREPTDMELIVHNSDMTPRPGDMHDDPDSLLIARVYGVGDYCVAVSDHDLVNNLTSDIADESFRDGLLIEQPGIILCTSPAAPLEDISFRVGTANRMAVISIRKDEPYDVNFVSFSVVPQGTPVPPTGEPLARPGFASNCGDAAVLLTVRAYAGLNPTSTDLSVVVDTSLIGGPALLGLVDDGTAGDEAAGDGLFSAIVLIAAGSPAGHARLPFTVGDSFGRSVSEFIHLDIDPCAPDCPACPADFNSDGGVDGADVSEFFAFWESGDGCADSNEDGGIDGGDVEVFFALWEAGDPLCTP